MVANLIHENIWTDKAKYDDAERLYYERLAKSTSLTPLADEVAKARQHLIQIRGTIEKQSDLRLSNNDVAEIHKKLNMLEKTILKNSERLSILESRVLSLEEKGTKTGIVKCPVKPKAAVPSKSADSGDDDDDDDVDLFGSDSEEESEAAAKIREQRLAAYNEKKSKKAPLIAKSNVILDVKPWDDETDMGAMEKEVRKITTDGLLWGAAKLVPLAYGIHKLQISCVVEDDKVSIDWLQEQIEQIEDYVQSVDIAAFNKI